MKFTAAAVLAAAAGAAAWENVTYTTEVVEILTTYCPAPTTITYGSSTITVTEPTTLTITDCSCTITKPVTTTSSVYCPPTDTPTYANTTMVSVTPTASISSTGGMVPPPSETPITPPGSGAGKAAALSGASLAGVVGIAAFLL